MTDVPKAAGPRTRLLMVAAMLLVAVLSLWANTRERIWHPQNDPNRWTVTYGWPLRVLQTDEVVRENGKELVLNASSEPFGAALQTMDYASFAADLLLACAAIGLTAYVGERLHRRREAKSHA
ncbi:MAG: hypothetical protein HY291_12575 [Planctomycetes bacterium]|nr:hypothetical protein [Planctomycetota bacterium]